MHNTAGGGVHRALCEKWAILNPFFPMAEMTAVTTVFPDTGLLRFLLRPKTQTTSYNKTIFPTKNAEDCCQNLLFLPLGRRSPGGGWLSGWSRERLLTIEHVPGCPETPPGTTTAPQGRRVRDSGFRRNCCPEVTERVGSLPFSPPLLAHPPFQGRQREDAMAATLRTLQAHLDRITGGRGIAAMQDVQWGVFAKQHGAPHEVELDQIPGDRALSPEPGGPLPLPPPATPPPDDGRLAAAGDGDADSATSRSGDAATEPTRCLRESHAAMLSAIALRNHVQSAREADARYARAADHWLAQAQAGACSWAPPPPRRPSTPSPCPSPAPPSPTPPPPSSPRGSPRPPLSPGAGAAPAASPTAGPRPLSVVARSPLPLSRSPYLWPVTQALGGPGDRVFVDLPRLCQLAVHTAHEFDVLHARTPGDTETLAWQVPPPPPPPPRPLLPVARTVATRS